jgi:uncharacterized glyoxalase superfamily protein PhnB
MTWSAKLASWPSVADAGRAVDFYRSAFGAVEPERLEVLHGGVNHRRIDGKRTFRNLGLAGWCDDPGP